MTAPSVFEKLIAILRRDLLTTARHRTGLGVQAVAVLVELAGFYFLATLFNLPMQTSSNKIREDLILLVSTGVALGLLYWAFRLGHQQAQWGAGIGMVVGAYLAFFVLFLGGMFTFGKIHWQ